MREFPLQASYGDGGGGPICKLAPFCALIAQTEGLRFCPPHSRNFLLICSLHLCNYCSGVEMAWNLREFPLPALYGDGGGGPICKLASICALIAKTEGLHF